MRIYSNGNKRNIRRESNQAPNTATTPVVPSMAELIRGLEDFDNLLPVGNDDQHPSQTATSSSPSTTRFDRDRRRHREKNNNYQQRQSGGVEEEQEGMVTRIAGGAGVDDGSIPSRRRPAPQEESRHLLDRETRQQQQRPNLVVSNQLDVTAPFAAPFEIYIPQPGLLFRIDSGVTLPWELQELELSHPTNFVDMNDSDENVSEVEDADARRRYGNFSRRDFLDDEQLEILLWELKEEDFLSLGTGREISVGSRT